MATSLDDVLEPKEEKEDAVEAPVETSEVAEEKPDDRPRGPDGKFIKADEAPEEKPESKPEVKTEPKAEEKPKAEPKQELSEKERGLLAAAQEERRKRQELERRLQEIEAAKTQEPPKQFWDDPEEAIAKIKAEIDRSRVSTKVETAELITRARYQDYDEKIQAFSQLAQANPWLLQQMVSAPNPAEFAYSTAKNVMELQAAGGLDSLMAKREAELRAKWESEAKERNEKAAAEAAAARAKLPGSLTDAPGARVNKVVWSGPTSLDGVLGK